MSQLNTKDERYMVHGGVLAGVFVISMSLLLSELLLTRIFSVIFMYHFAFLVISLAMFGMGVGGIAVYLYPERFAGDLQRRLVTLALAFAASLVALVLFLFNLPLAPSGSARGAIVIGIVFLVSSVPFFIGGTCLSILLGRAGKHVNRLYFVDLVGAGVGCFIIIPMLNYLGGVTALLTASCGAALSALLFALPEPNDTKASPESGAIVQRVLTILAVATALGLAFSFFAEPAARWIGEMIFNAHPVYSTRKHPFSFYFDRNIGPEIHNITTAARVPLLIAFVAAAAGWAWVRRTRGTNEGRALFARRELMYASAVALVGIVAFVGLNTHTNAIRIRFAKGRVEFQNLFEGWNSFSRIAVLPRTGNITYAWGLSPLYKGDPGEHLAIDIDSLAGTPLVRFGGDINEPGLDHLAHDVTALAYVLRPAMETLIIGPGGGRDVLTALKFGSKSIDAIELNPLMKKVVNEAFGDFTGRLYERPEIRLTIDDGRHFVRNSDRAYKVIQLSLVDTWASTAAGAFALSENSLYTAEAFIDYLQHLAPDGVLTVSRWLDITPRESLRVISLARVALAEVGVTDATQHIMVAGTPSLRRGHRFASVVISRRPFTADEIAAAQKFVDDRGFDILYFPGMPRDPVFSELVTTPDMDGFLNNYPLDVTPTTDDRPFFFNTAWPRDFFKLWQPSDGRVGVHLLARVLLIVVTLVLIFMLGPLYLRRRSALAGVESISRWSTLLYFSALGAGFMLVEVALISKFVLFLGHPINALTVVLCTLLISAGIGSQWSGRHVDGGHAAIARIIGMALVAIIALDLVLELLFVNIVGWPFWICVLITIATLGPVGFLMGMPFPLALRLLDRVGPKWAELIPWVWGINGASSVLGSILAISVAINFGFRFTLLTGLGVYGLAFVTSRYLAGGAGALAATEKAPKKAARA